jgi:hypothetical protein
MPLQDLSTPPTPPSRNDPPEVFIQRADAFVAWQAQFAAEMNTLTAQLEATAALIAAAPAYADPGLLALAGNTPAADRLPYYDAADGSALATFTAAGRALLDDATASDQLTTLGLSANGKSLATAANYAAMRALLDLEPGVDVQAYDSDLAAIAALTTTAYGRALLTKANAGEVLVSASTLAMPGYVKLASGLTLQWAQGSYTTGEGTQIVSWPVFFENSCLIALVTTSIASSGAGSDAMYQIVGTPGAASVTVQRQIMASGTDTISSCPFIFGVGY